mgnify:CR=1 FL=1
MRSPLAKTVTVSRRAIATSVTSSASARAMASDVGAEMATSVRAPKVAAFSTISNEHRLVMTTKPEAGSTPRLTSPPLSLSRALWRPTSSRRSTISPARLAPAPPRPAPAATFLPSPGSRPPPAPAAARRLPDPP